MFERENTNCCVSVKGVMRDTDGQVICFFGSYFLISLKALGNFTGRLGKKIYSNLSEPRNPGTLSEYFKLPTAKLTPPS